MPKTIQLPLTHFYNDDENIFEIGKGFAPNPKLYTGNLSLFLCFTIS